MAIPLLNQTLLQLAAPTGTRTVSPLCITVGWLCPPGLPVHVQIIEILISRLFYEEIVLFSAVLLG